jgi:hypothetical protein
MIPTPPPDLLPPYAEHVLAAVGWLLAGLFWWTRRKR